MSSSSSAKIDPSPLEQSFRHAVQSGSVAAVQSCLQQDRGGTLVAELPRALFQALVSINLDLVKVLLQHDNHPTARQRVEQLLLSLPYIEEGLGAGGRDSSVHFPLLCAVKLDFVEAVEVIFGSCSNGARQNLLALTTPLDEIFRIGTIPIFSSAGRNILHLAVHEHSLSTLRRLLSSTSASADGKEGEEVPPLLSSEESLALLQQRDADGITPLQLALLRPISVTVQKEDPILAILGGSQQVPHRQGKAPTDDEKKEYIKASRARITAAVEGRKRKQQQRVGDGENDESGSGGGGCCCGGVERPKHKTHFPGGLGDKKEAFINPKWRESITEICDVSKGGGVWTVEFFSEQAVKWLREEIHNVEAFYKDKELTRPNSMNNYGFTIAEVGLGELLSDLVDDFEDLAKALPLSTRSGWASRNDKNGIDEKNMEEKDCDDDDGDQVEFSGMHAFTIKYAVNGDKTLATHVDDSDFTFNINLGDEFTGATLYFHGEVPQCEELEHPNDAAIRRGFRFPDYAHRPGVAVVHRGNIPHGVNPLTGGQRVNLVVWLKEKKKKN